MGALDVLGTTSRMQREQSSAWVFSAQKSKKNYSARVLPARRHDAPHRATYVATLSTLEDKQKDRLASAGLMPFFCVALTSVLRCTASSWCYMCAKISHCAPCGCQVQ